MRSPPLPPVVRYWLPPLLWAVFTFLGSSVRQPIAPAVPGLYLDKPAHMIEYGVLGALLFRAFATGEQFRVRSAVLLTILFATAYGFSDEIHQSFVPGRDCEFSDVVADFAGSALASACFVLYLTRRAKKQ